MPPADKNIQITIAINIDKRRIGIVTYMSQTKRVSDSGSKNRIARCSSIFKKQRIATTIPDKRIQIAIGVNVNKIRIAADSQAKWITLRRRKDWIIDRADIFKKMRAASFTDKSIRIPSPSMSANTGNAQKPIALKPKGLVIGAAKMGLLAFPVFRKNNVLPSTLPTKTSRSRSPSISTKSGLAYEPTLLKPNGLLATKLKTRSTMKFPLINYNLMIPGNFSPTASAAQDVIAYPVSDCNE
ncbi:MAG TPA: hypothetical protein VK141_10050 [Nitrosomonas sp.]|nr:hypothetical protein [Nitrosomonas sp.]